MNSLFTFANCKLQQLRNYKINFLISWAECHLSRIHLRGLPTGSLILRGKEFMRSLKVQPTTRTCWGTRVRTYARWPGPWSSILVNMSLITFHRLRLPVPPGFIITTETCLEYFHSNKTFPESLLHEYTRAVHDIEKHTGRIFGSKDVHFFPLLLSVRSGAAVSMPG